METEMLSAGIVHRAVVEEPPVAGESRYLAALSSNFFPRF